MLTLLPWHESNWEQLGHARANDMLPHAYLLHGAPGTGRNEFALYLAGSLLCTTPQESFSPCLNCKSCHLFTAGNHTDLSIIQPEEQGKQIKVDQIRTLIEFISLKSRYEGYKIVIINPAEAMNRNAANAILKTLEEPPPLSLLLLVIHRPELLPVTIRSRCQILRFNPDFSVKTCAWLSQKVGDAALATELLTFANGSPLRALEIFSNNTLDNYRQLLSDMEKLSAESTDPVSIAEQWNTMGAEQVLLWLLQYFKDFVESVYAGSEIYPNFVNRHMPRLKLTKSLDLYKLIACYDLLLQNYRLCTGHVSHDKLGLLEEFVIYWQQQFQPSGEQAS